MSIICAICGKKQSGFFDNYPLSAEHKEMRICVRCQERIQAIEDAPDDTEVNDAVGYFNNIFVHGARPEAIQRINNAVNKRLGIVNDAAPTPSAPITEISEEKDGKQFNIDNLYTDIGKKIKSWAKWIFVIETIGAIIGAFGMMISGDEVLLLAGILSLVLGPIIAFVSTWILYAFGELVDKACIKEQQDEKYYAFMSENLKAMRANSDKMLELLKKEKNE